MASVSHRRRVGQKAKKTKEHAGKQQNAAGMSTFHTNPLQRQLGDFQSQQGLPGCRRKHKPASAKNVKPPPPPPKTQAPERKGVRANDGHNYEGAAPFQFALLAHNMGLISALMITVTGAFAILWLGAKRYKCEVDGESINIDYIIGSAPVLCDPEETSEEIDLGGHRSIGLFSIILGPISSRTSSGAWASGSCGHAHACVQDQSPCHRLYGRGHSTLPKQRDSLSSILLRFDVSREFCCWLAQGGGRR